MNNSKGRLYGILTGILLVVLGGIFVLRPLSVAYFTEIIAGAGFIVYGIFRISQYVNGRPVGQTFWTLVLGVLSIILGILIFAMPELIAIEVLAFTFAFLSLSNGINQIVLSKLIADKSKTSKGLIIANGVANIIFGILLFLSPFFLTAILEFVTGIYLVFGGITIAVESFSHSKQ